MSVSFFSSVDLIQPLVFYTSLSIIEPTPTKIISTALFITAISPLLSLMDSPPSTRIRNTQILYSQGILGMCFYYGSNLLINLEVKTSHKNSFNNFTLQTLFATKILLSLFFISQGNKAMKNISQRDNTSLCITSRLANLILQTYSYSHLIAKLNDVPTSTLVKTATISYVFSKILYLSFQKPTTFIHSIVYPKLDTILISHENRQELLHSTFQSIALFIQNNTEDVEDARCFCTGCTLNSLTRIQTSTPSLEEENFFIVHLDILENSPEKVLLDLYAFILANNYSMPKFKIIDQTQTLQGNDVGGVMRHVISTLMEFLFNETTPRCFGLLKNIQGKSPSVSNQEFLRFFPYYVTIDSIDSLTCLGTLIGHAYNHRNQTEQSNSSKVFTLGNFFDSLLFKALLSLKKDDILFIKQYVENMLENTSIPQELLCSVFLSFCPQELERHLENYEQYLTSLKNNELLRDLIDNSPLPPSKEEFIQKLVMNPSTEIPYLGLIQGVIHIAYGINLVIKESWETLLSHHHETFQEIIEGKICPFDLIENRFKSSSSFEEDPYKRVFSFLKTWIENTSAQKLSLFLKAVTGNLTLPQNSIITICFDQATTLYRDISSQSCFFQLTLSTNIKTQTEFDDKIEFFLKHSLAGSGFGDDDL